MLYKFSQSILIVFVVFAGMGTAQELARPQAQINPEKAALIRELIAITGTTKSVSDVADGMMKFQQEETEKRSKTLFDDQKELTPADREELNRFLVESSARVSKRISEFFKTGIDLDRVIDETMVPIYDKHFTEAELREFIAFYKSPTGKKVIELMPQMMIETMTAFSARVSPKMDEFLKKVTEDEVALFGKKLEEKRSGPKAKAKP